MNSATNTPSIYGLMAEFMTPEEVVEAATMAYDAGYRKMDAFAPLPVEGLSEAVGFRKTRLPLMVLIGGIIGALGGFGMQYWMSVVDYPMNVGGRPYYSWPSFIPITFELTVLCASLTAVFGMIALNGLPMPYHPVFNVRSFERASTDRFFLCIESEDPRFDTDATRQFLAGLPNAADVTEVPY